ncbi:hypothetical protein AURDEDRAFT_169149 [Auricularia subglabra TFB-10046 SS5]|nr:hypothetical protein AURDEDRAFT_169149 [Auricularia subglabra TFB-10046 SS5]
MQCTQTTSPTTRPFAGSEVDDEEQAEDEEQVEDLLALLDTQNQVGERRPVTPPRLASPSPDAWTPDECVQLYASRPALHQEEGGPFTAASPPIASASLHYTPAGVAPFGLPLLPPSFASRRALHQEEGGSFTAASPPIASASLHYTPAGVAPLGLPLLPPSSFPFPIPKPPGQVTRLKRGGYSLISALGWDNEQYIRVQKVVHKYALQYLDTSRPYAKRDPVKFDLVC